MITPRYELIKNGKWGRLLEDYAYYTPIKGYFADMRLENFHCSLREDGFLVIYSDSEWDFGSGPAVDTPAMVIASLAHDAGCHMTNHRVLPWECRARFDAYFRELLKTNGNGLWRYVRWAGVVTYSQLVARWKDQR